MSTNNSTRWTGIILLWVIIALLGAAIVFKFILKPGHKKRLQDSTSARSQYDYQITVNLDSFSGYSILRSEVFKEELKAGRIRLTLVDDHADYRQRIRDLEKGKCQFAVFTVDSLIFSSVDLGDWPGTIILGIDESHGADAVIAYKTAMPNLNSLDDPQAKIVLTPNSPSEFMARIITAHFSLKGLAGNYIEAVDGSAKVYEKFISADRLEKKAYIMWEPDVSKALEKEDSHVLVDSSKIKGHIFDILVVQREFLAEHENVADKVIEAYLKAAYFYRDDMAGLILKDAQTSGDWLVREQAEKIAAGILWKNTVENYAHFGLLDKSETKGLDHMEDVIQKITAVLVNTGAINSDPFGGNYAKLFYDGILLRLKQDNFHPGRKINLLADELGILDAENVRGAQTLPALTDDQWEQLVSVGKMKINPLSFGRGKATIGIQNQRDLDELSDKLKSWQGYYLLIVGHARKEGDQQLNKQLAQERAEIVKKYLIDQCAINPDRIKAKAAKVFNRGGEGQSVSFVVGQATY